MENTSLWERRKVMVKRKMKTTLLITIMLLSMTIGTSVQAAGCSDYKLSAKCTNKLCPGGLKRKERQDLYKQTCVRADGSIYYNKDYRTVYVSCSCL